MALGDGPSRGYGGGHGPVAQLGTVAPGEVAVFVGEGIITGAVKYVEEAPYDGQLYGRQSWEWVPIPAQIETGGTVTSITAGTGLSGGTITSAGTIGLQTPVSLAYGGTGVSVASQEALLSALGGAPIYSPALMGAARSMNAPALTDNSTQIATTAWVTAKIAASGVVPPPSGGATVGAGLGGGATVGLGGGVTVGLGGAEAALREQIAALEARLAALEGTK